MLGAQRAGITKVLIPRDNVSDLKDLPPEIREQMTVVAVDTIEDVLHETIGITLAPIEHIFLNEQAKPQNAEPMRFRKTIQLINIINEHIMIGRNGGLKYESFNDQRKSPQEGMYIYRAERDCRYTDKGRDRVEILTLGTDPIRIASPAANVLSWEANAYLTTTW